MTGASGACASGFGWLIGVIGGVVYPSMLQDDRTPAPPPLKYERYGLFVTDTIWTLEGWTPAAWATASTRACSWS